MNYSRSKIKENLEKENFNFKKKFGQNFIVDKNIIENKIGLKPLNNGLIPISKVVAAVLGIASNGPKHIIIAEPSIIPNVLPLLDNTVFTSPLHFEAETIASSDNPTSASINPPNPTNQLEPDITPKNGGNIKFPAPKNIANNANPNIITSLFVLFI